MKNFTYITYNKSMEAAFNGTQVKNKQVVIDGRLFIRDCKGNYITY